MNDNYAKFEFKIQFLHTCHESNDDSVYTVSVGKIYSIYIYIFQVQFYSCFRSKEVNSSFLSLTHLLLIIRL